jgi:hypothetical protein
MTEQGSGPETHTDPKEVGDRLLRTVAWLAVAAVAALVIALCILVLYVMGIL